MEIRPLRETDDRLAVSRIYEESWKSAYRGVIPQAYLDAIPVGRWAANRGCRDALLWVLEENRRARRFYERQGFRFSGEFMDDEIGGKPLREVLYLRHIE